jgi:hypothetical protein
LQIPDAQNVIALPTARMTKRTPSDNFKSIPTWPKAGASTDK